MEKLTTAITNAIQVNNPDLTDLQIIKIKFGIQCLLSEFSKFCMYILIFSIFSSTGYFLTAMFSFCIFRAFSGGYHEETYWRCFFTTFFLFILIIFIGIKMSLSLWTWVGGLTLGGIITAVYAPVDHPNKPIISLKRRTRLKVLSVIVFMLFILGSLLLSGAYKNIMLAAIIVQAFTLPLGFIKKKHIENRQLKI